uniref:Uncharacterized protein n=1 Tax=Macrostomum lignano TaxID=282301 RepID=A0A1I8IMI1_9PLAT
MINFLSRPFMKLKRELELKTSTSPKWMSDVMDGPGDGGGGGGAGGMAFQPAASNNGYLNVSQPSQRSSKSSSASGTESTASAAAAAAAAAIMSQSMVSFRLRQDDAFGSGAAAAAGMDTA